MKRYLGNGRWLITPEGKAGLRWQRACYRAFLKTPEWRHCRNVVLERDDRLCVFCASPATEVHHTCYLRLTSAGFCISVCRECHEECELERQTDPVGHLAHAPTVRRFAEKYFRCDDYEMRYTAQEVGQAFLDERQRQFLKWSVQRRQ